MKVYVNPSGKVEYSEVLSKVASTDRDLAASAVFAARGWEFVPAHAGEGPVSGEVILHYQFGPGVRVDYWGGAKLPRPPPARGLKSYPAGGSAPSR